jgi:hypothetical protein
MTALTLALTSHQSWGIAGYAGKTRVVTRRPRIGGDPTARMCGKGIARDTGSFMVNDLTVYAAA